MTPKLMTQSVYLSLNMQRTECAEDWVGNELFLT